MAEEFQVGNNSNWWDTSRKNSRFGENGDETSSTSATLKSTSSSGWPRKTSQSLPIHQEYPGSLRAGGRGGGGQPNLQMMGLGLSSEAMDWNNQPVFRDEKADGNATSFRWMLEDQMSSNTYFHDHESADQDHWRQKLHDKPYSDSEAAYEDQSSLLALDNHHPSNSYQTSYSSWNNPSNNNVCCKFPQFIVRGTSPSKQQHHATGTGQMQFSNNTLFWNPTTAAINDVRSSFVPLLQTQLTTPTIDEKQKEIQTETSNKRSRCESSSHSPAFKVRKEKMGDRINALQQLVSPFGKTDTASVLSEAIEYIKFLHDQVNVLSTPYMRNGALVQNQKHLDNKANDTEDLRSRGLCLVPLSTTFWIPTFGPTFT